MSPFTQALNRWLICPRPNRTAALRLFCLPHAGGGAGLFRGWPASLSPAVEVRGVQPPGRESRISEKPFTRLEPLVAALTDVLAASIDRPYILYGHSMGALLAFELTRS